MKTSAQVANELGITPRSVRRWCERLGLERIGRDYVLTPKEVRLVTEHYHPGPGQPKKERTI